MHGLLYWSEPLENYRLPQHFLHFKLNFERRRYIRLLLSLSLSQIQRRRTRERFATYMCVCVCVLFVCLLVCLWSHTTAHLRRTELRHSIRCNASSSSFPLLPLFWPNSISFIKHKINIIAALCLFCFFYHVTFRNLEIYTQTSGWKFG